MVATCACGIIVVEEVARAAGSGSVPDPAVDISAPWLWWSYIAWRRAEVVQRLLVDNRAMRKLKDSQAVVMVIKNRGTASVNVSWGLRWLLKD